MIQDNLKSLNKFKVGDWVRFNAEAHKGARGWLTERGVDISKPYKVISVKWDAEESVFLYRLDFKNGKNWGEPWFCIDKRSIVLDIIKDLL